LKGKVAAVSENRVKVEYSVGGERCDKTLLKSSPDLRLLPKEAHSPLRPADTPDPGAAPGPQQMQLRLPVTPGEWLRIADLEFGEILGKGGFGAVYRGLLKGQEVAIKRMHILEGGHVPPGQLAEFQKEVANLQALRHPRLIRFIGVAIDPPSLSIVTELSSGGSLYGLLHQRKVPLQQGVAFLHQLHPPFVHRDLKSANVVLDAELGAKLCDFGLTESMEKTHISRRDAEGGSPRYMAPESFDSRKKITEKVDVWALGCLVIEVYTGLQPHEDCTSIQQVAAKLLVRLEKPFPDELPAIAIVETQGSSKENAERTEVAKLVDPCFQREPSQRPSAASLLEGLQRVEVAAQRGGALPAVPQVV